MKKIFKIFVVLSFMIMCFNSFPNFTNAKTSTSESIPVYNSIEEWELSGDESDTVRIKDNKSRYQGGYLEYKLVSTKKANDVRVGYHPDFPKWNYWDGYYFSTSSKTTFSPSVSLQWGKVSVGVSVAKSSKSSGTFRKANGKKRSRPWVRADITTRIYDSYIYDDRGQLITKLKDNHRRSTSSDVQIFIDHK